MAKRYDKNHRLLRTGEVERADGYYVYRWTSRDGKRHSVTANIMPDHTTVDERNAYGYTSDIMLPMDKSRALELFGEGKDIYLLYPDNTEAMALERADISDFDGMFGIERADWLEIVEQGAFPREAKIYSENMEAEFLFGSDNGFALYQLDDREDLRDIHFENLKGIGGAENVRKENYNMVYSDTIDIEPTDDIYEILNGIYDQFNIDRPDDFTGHSLSVSDIIAIRNNGEVNAYFVDSYGFEEVEHFYGENKQEIVWDGKK